MTQSNTPLWRELYNKSTDDDREQAMEALDKYRDLAALNLASLAEALEAAIKREEKYRAILTGDRTYFTPPYTNKMCI